MSTETETREPDCRQIEPLLDDLVDGQLSAAERARVRRHLEGCASCAAQLAELEELLAGAAELPRAIEPTEDLWPHVAPRLSARPVAPAAGHRPTWPRQAAAAVLFMALGGVLSHLPWPGGAAAPAPGRESSAALASVDPRADFALAEADYLRAKEALWAAVYHGRHQGSPETREVVERNLRVIDEAIAELRQALASDPGNRQLENLLLAQHRTEIDLLRRLKKTTETS